MADDPHWYIVTTDIGGQRFRRLPHWLSRLLDFVGRK